MLLHSVSLLLPFITLLLHFLVLRQTVLYPVWATLSERGSTFITIMLLCVYLACHMCYIGVCVGGDGWPIILIDRESYSSVLNWQQAAFKRVIQGAHKNNYKLHGEDCK